MSNYRDVVAFHQKYGLGDPEHGLPLEPGPREVPEELVEFRRKFLAEELEEFDEGREQGDQAKMADALVDLVYVAMGTALLMGYPWEELWADVQAANMRKVRAKRDGSDSARGSGWDVVKPPGWQPPATDKILVKYGFKTEWELLGHTGNGGYGLARRFEPCADIVCDRRHTRDGYHA